MRVERFSLPYAAYIVDDFLDPAFLQKVLRESEPLKKYHAYDDEHAKKITSVPGGVKGVMRDALTIIANATQPLYVAWPNTAPDMSFYGAGVSIMRPGDFLKPHVDHAIHPKTKHTRMFNALLYLTECEGGELRLIGPDTEVRIKPKKNRLAFFQSYGVRSVAVEPVTGGERIALSVYFYSSLQIPFRDNTKARFL